MLCEPLDWCESLAGGRRWLPMAVGVGWLSWVVVVCACTVSRVDASPLASRRLRVRARQLPIPVPAHGATGLALPGGLRLSDYARKGPRSEEAVGGGWKQSCACVCVCVCIFNVRHVLLRGRTRWANYRSSSPPPRHCSAQRFEFCRGPEAAGLLHLVARRGARPRRAQRHTLGSSFFSEQLLLLLLLFVFNV